MEAVEDMEMPVNQEMTIYESQAYSRDSWPTACGDGHVYVPKCWPMCAHHVSSKFWKQDLNGN